MTSAFIDWFWDAAAAFPVASSATQSALAGRLTRRHVVVHADDQKFPRFQFSGGCPFCRRGPRY